MTRPSSGLIGSMRTLRHKNHMSKNRLAKTSEVGESTIKSWERKVSDPSIGKFEKVLRVFGKQLAIVDIPPGGRNDNEG